MRRHVLVAAGAVAAPQWPQHPLEPRLAALASSFPRRLLRRAHRRRPRLVVGLVRRIQAELGARGRLCVTLDGGDHHDGRRSGHVFGGVGHVVRGADVDARRLALRDARAALSEEAGAELRCAGHCLHRRRAVRTAVCTTANCQQPPDRLLTVNALQRGAKGR